MYDTIIRGGLVVDGTGAPSQTADIGIKHGLIAAIGKIDDPANRVVDADGALVTPGWVDAHTHYDGQVTWDDKLEGSASNGVTTVVMGNCGVGFAPVAAGGAASLIDLMEGVEDIPGTALYEGMPWGAWETFPEYLEYLDSREWTIDVSAQLAHGALRFYAMGERALSRDRASESDILRMAEMARDAVRAGAVGFSTSRIMGHRSMSGFAVPGTYAHEDELAAIADGMKAGGGATIQAIPSTGAGASRLEEQEYSDWTSEIALFARISRQTGQPVVLSTSQTNDAPDNWRTVLADVARENGTGARLAPMIAPRANTSLQTLGAYHIFMRRPTYAKLADLPLAQRVVEMRRPEVKAAILSEADDPHPQAGSMENILPMIFRKGLRLTFALTDPIDYEPDLEKSLYAEAMRQGRDPLEYLYDFLLGDDGKAVAVYLAANYVGGNLDVCREMLLDPHTVSGLSDAGAHVNFICDMAMPTFNLTHWTRDRTRGAQLPIELVVQKSTSTPARLFGLNDRGSLEVGRRADINIVDHTNLKVHVPTVHNDLPAGGTRFLQRSSGYLATFVSGIQTLERDRDMGARPGRVARPSRGVA